MAESFLYLTTIGRKSGEPRRIEIWFVVHEVDHRVRYYLCAERREASGWVQNISKDPRVRFSVGPRGSEGSVVAECAARARVVSDGDEPDLMQAVRAAFDMKYGWSSGLLVDIAPEPPGA